ncbi:hypothetical protein [Janthinobacterium sp. 1_2014MBL_MicDiv]|uniref:hypothetical protein n=1 Tax=Janthinobacterium sp. 1_2014MBL_MicDiv TaxID=1644131 RepID=UPI0008F4BD07|nr:hypothetical protein [Janthinobacterium sp. 1_2014MBL_MicDiv]APA68500.1 membrane protein [Janthinobacterium sp. 1_2014MBL_MicDiv]
MHTILVMGAGFALLALCLLIGRGRGAMAHAALAFIPLWLVGAGINMAVGVLGAGYSVAEELPIFAVIFAVPALLAGFLWWRLQRA